MLWLESPLLWSIACDVATPVDMREAVWVMCTHFGSFHGGVVMPVFRTWQLPHQPGGNRKATHVH